MQQLLTALNAAADPTRLRLLALAARGAFCVVDFVEILAQSQPRLSRHLRLLCEAGLLDRMREGANCWFGVPPGAAGALVHDLLRRLPGDDPVLAADARAAARVLAERARVASAAFQRRGADWDEMRALNLPAQAVEERLLDLLPGRLGRLLDLGTGTGRLLELLAPRVESGLGIDASRAMLALARVRLARPEFVHCRVQHGDLYAPGVAARGFDLVVLQMVLHHLDDPPSALAAAAGTLRPGGRLVVIDLAAHQRQALTAPLAHRWPGFTEARMQALLSEAGLAAQSAVAVAGPLEIRIWLATTADTGVADVGAAARGAAGPGCGDLAPESDATESPDRGSHDRGSHGPEWHGPEWHGRELHDPKSPDPEWLCSRGRAAARQTPRHLTAEGSGLSMFVTKGHRPDGVPRPAAASTVAHPLELPPRVARHRSAALAPRHNCKDRR